ncbi:MAG: hypothetical protein IH907_03525 [Proteobacteria bacterium]|nr:hypothetical protein [Pseudomonadota bacterium]
MRKRFFLLGFVLFSPAISFAEDLDWSLFHKRVDEAEIIFRGTVISKQYRDSAGDYGGVFTIYSFEVHEEFKGELPDGTLIVRTGGGASPSGGGISFSSASPAFSLGGDYLLFMAEFGNGRLSVLPGGVLRIDVGPISGNPVLLMSGLQVLDFDENGPILGRGPIVPSDQPLSDMGIISVESDSHEFAAEVIVDFKLLVEKLR